MSDPVRWKDGGGPDGIKELLRVAARPAPMTAAQRAHTAARVAKLAQGVGVGAGGATGGGALIKGIVIAAGLGITAAALRALLPASSSPESPAATEIRAPAVAADPDVTVDTAANDLGSPSAIAAPSTSARRSMEDGEVKPTERARRPSAPRPAVSASPSSAAADALLEEAQSLERVRARVAADPAGALRSLAEHHQRFPRAQLAAEREYLTIDALKRLGRREEARARAQAFLARYPSSPYTAEVGRSAQEERPAGAVTNP